MNVAFKAERSIEDEIERGSESDLLPIAISYAFMFCYITFTLGEYHDCKTFLVKSKVILGFFGVLIVLVSVCCALGLFCFLGVPATLIIVEVVPFLVLAVGVDNIFILVQAFQREEKKFGQTLEERIGFIVGKVAPSMLLSSISMSSCFFIGSDQSILPVVQVAGRDFRNSWIPLVAGTTSTWMKSRRICKRFLAYLLGIVMVWGSVTSTPPTESVPPTGGDGAWQVMVIRTRPSVPNICRDNYHSDDPECLNRAGIIHSVTHLRLRDV
ncbi:NPC intracellular cholesterol transporter 1 [Araneus ventricosus]|uniref:NPC intracellular cholesterol transporter 1 n=1 Tax=Araneus ventricosus TaxID=182803 RepID=A0A4Y2VZ22_ARAVE|nr:NPC intracellular cholesterol transporter 1 [Araneus ventricosus]